MLSDQYIEHLSNQAFVFNMGEYTTPAFQKMIRITVAEGLKRMYKEYRLTKWLKVQAMANTVRRVLDGGNMQSQSGPIVPYGQRSISASPGQQHEQNWQMAAPEAYQWQPAMYEFQASPGPYIRLVSPINSPLTNSVTVVHQMPALPDPYESTIQLVENPSARRDLFHSEEPTVLDLATNPHSVLDCAIQDISGLSDSSDEVLDSVNVINPHGHSHHGHAAYPTSVATNQNFIAPSIPSEASASYDVIQNQSVPILHQQEIVNQSVSFPTMPQSQQRHPMMPPFHETGNETFSDSDDSMDWDSEGSSYNDSEESLAGVLFAAERLLPDEQAVRLDVEMGDMGVGHVLFDRVSAAWYTAHCEFYRAD